MRRKLIIATSFIFLLSCSSSRKVKRDKLEYTGLETKNITQTQDGTYVATGEVNYILNQKDLTIEPVDNTKPMKVNGKEYLNAKIKSSDKKENIQTKNKDSVALKTKIDAEVLKKEKASLNKQESERKGQGMFVIYFIIIGALIIVVYFIIFLYNKYKQKIPLI